MKQIDLLLYKTSKQYFRLYDIYLKYIGKNKEDYLTNYLLTIVHIDVREIMRKSRKANY